VVSCARLVVGPGVRPICSYVIVHFDMCRWLSLVGIAVRQRGGVSTGFYREAHRPGMVPVEASFSLGSIAGESASGAVREVEWFADGDGRRREGGGG